MTVYYKFNFSNSLSLLSTFWVNNHSGNQYVRRRNGEEYMLTAIYPLSSTHFSVMHISQKVLKVAYCQQNK